MEGDAEPQPQPQPPSAPPCLHVVGAELQSIPEGMEVVPTTTTQQHEEIQRRADAAADLRGCDEHSSFERVTDADELDPPFQAADQRWVVYGLSHVGMPPIASDPSNPGVRIYGLLSSKQEALEYAAELGAADKTSCLLVGPTHDWEVAVKSVERARDPAYKASKKRRIAEAHALLRAASTAEFRSNVEAAKTGGHELATEDTVVSTAARERRRAERGDAFERLQRDGTQAGTRVPGAATIEGQRHAVCCFVKDVSPEVVAGDDDPEFCFMVLAAFDTKKECDRYVRNVAADRIQEHALDVVDLRRWLYPEHPDLEEKVSIVYRHKELTEVMQRKKADVGEVDRFKREQERIGRPVEIRDIPADPVSYEQPLEDRVPFAAELFGAEADTAADTEADAQGGAA